MEPLLPPKLPGLRPPLWPRVRERLRAIPSWSAVAIVLISLPVIFGLYSGPPAQPAGVAALGPTACPATVRFRFGSGPGAELYSDEAAGSRPGPSLAGRLESSDDGAEERFADQVRVLSQKGCERQLALVNGMIDARRHGKGNATTVVVIDPDNAGGAVPKTRTTASAAAPGDAPACHVRVEVGYGERTDKARILATLLGHISRHARESSPKTRLSASITASGRSFYLGFYDRCDRKFETARALISAYRERFPHQLSMTLSEPVIGPADLTDGSVPRITADGHAAND